MRHKSAIPLPERTISDFGFEADRARDARLTSLGYQVVRFMHRQVTTKPEAVAATLRALLAPRPRRVRA